MLKGSPKISACWHISQNKLIQLVRFTGIGDHVYCELHDRVTSSFKPMISRAKINQSNDMELSYQYLESSGWLLVG